MSLDITETPDCCEVWPLILNRFGWFAYADRPDLLAMPYLPGGDGIKWRVNHCPSCGREVRSCVVRLERLESLEAAQC